MSLPFSVEELQKAVEIGDVTARPHESLPYVIYNYSPETQFSKKWNRVTRACRGLILDNDYNIIARPWEKFFNLGEVELPFQFTDPVEVMDKADGSLGILYPSFHPDGLDVYWNIATRGSFHSKQAAVGTRIYREKYSHMDPMPGYTMLFEIIYPANRIVLDYGDMEDLMLLGAVETQTGYYLGPREAKSMWRERGHLDPNYLRYAEWPGPVVETYDYPDVTTALGEMGRKNKEGYVVRRGNFIVKIKEPDYLDLHRLVTNCSPRTVWEQLREGKSVTEICSAFPDEFHGMVKGFAEPLVDAHARRVDEIFRGYSEVMQQAHRLITPGGNPLTRGDYARLFKKHKDAKYYFSLLDDRRIGDVVWTELKPKAQ